MWTQFVPLVFVGTVVALTVVTARCGEAACRCLTAAVIVLCSVAVQFDPTWTTYAPTIVTFELGMYAYELCCWDLDSAHALHHGVSLLVGVVVLRSIDLLDPVQVAFAALPQTVHVTNLVSELRKQNPPRWGGVYKGTYVAVKTSVLLWFVARCARLEGMTPGMQLTSGVYVLLFAVQLRFCVRIVRGTCTRLYTSRIDKGRLSESIAEACRG